MSYKSWKRNDQRKRSKARREFWISVRKYNADKAFEEWKKNYLLNPIVA